MAWAQAMPSSPQLHGMQQVLAGYGRLLCIKRSPVQRHVPQGDFLTSIQEGLQALGHEVHDRHLNFLNTACMLPVQDRIRR